MRKQILVLLLLSSVITVKAKQNVKPTAIQTGQLQNTQQDAKPEPVGGNDAFAKYMKRYVNHWYNNDQTGTVTLSFVVEKDGSITGYKIVHSLNAEADGITIQAAKDFSQKWKPAMQNGQPISAPYTITVPFG